MPRSFLINPLTDSLESHRRKSDYVAFTIKALACRNLQRTFLIF